MAEAASVRIREKRSSDAQALARLFYDAVRQGAAAYTPEQRAAWAPRQPFGPDWGDRLNAQAGRVAIDAVGRPVGFATMDAQGYADLAYILAPYQSRGLFRRLYDPLEADALSRGVRRLHTHASLMARPAFERVGYVVLAQETVRRDGVDLQRVHMEKTVTP